MALSKITLGQAIRNKITSLPIPDGEITLNGPEIAAEGETERDKLVDDLKEFLLELSNESLMESEANLQEHLENQFKHIPMLPLVV